MDNHTATELAYKNGYEQGKKDAVRHSRWVKDSDGDEYCENCWHYMPIREVTGDPTANNYCPNCGAKMDGDTHD